MFLCNLHPIQPLRERGRSVNVDTMRTQGLDAQLYASYSTGAIIVVGG